MRYRVRVASWLGVVHVVAVMFSTLRLATPMVLPLIFLTPTFVSSAAYGDHETTTAKDTKVDKASSEPDRDTNTVDGDAESDHRAGHSVLGEAFDQGPRQAAYLMANTGRVMFPITTKSPSAQQFFNQGVGQLHGFWYFEAERSFRQVAAIDPECAMAYWGMAAANANNADRAARFIAEAAKRKTNASPREVMYIDAWSKYLSARNPKGKQGAAAKKDNAKNDNAKSKSAKSKAETDANRQRKQQLIRDLEAIVQEHPADIEAKALLAWQIWAAKDVLPIHSYQAVDSLLEWVFFTESLHPAHHYRIHLWDDQKAARALHSAAHCGQSAPSIAHMWHMPGHTFSKLKRYADAAWQQEASARVDHAYMQRDRVMPYQIHNYAHNNEWCVRDLVYVGRANDALSLAKNLIELPRHPKLNSATEKNSAAAMGRERLLDVLVKFELHNELIRLADTPYLAETGDETHDVRRLRWLSAAHFSAGNQIQGSEQLAKLEARLNELNDKPAATPPTAATGSAPDKPQPAEQPPTEQPPAEAPPAETTKADDTKTAATKETPTKETAVKENTPKESTAKENTAKETPTKKMIDDKQRKARSATLEKAIAHARGAQAALAGDHKAALTLFEKAGDLDKSTLARAYLRAGNHEKAEDLARKAVEDGREQVLPLASYVEVLHARGKSEAAAKAFEQLRALSAQLDLDTPPFERLAPIANALRDGNAAGSSSSSTDWRTAYKLPPDVGNRPELSTLGPFRWQPSAADDWSLPDADGKPISLKRNFAGKPVVAIFYLGAGCLHCVEQLQKFVPLAKQYEEAGITLVGISTDTLDDLKSSVELFKVDGPFPFPLVSDAQLKVFKQYRCHDDFEQQPLHGTFLIDRDGLIRWQDTGSEPFLDAQFLLQESKRLLAQPRLEQPQAEKPR